MFRVGFLQTISVVRWGIRVGMCGSPVGNLIIDGMRVGMMDRKSEFSMKSILWAVVMHGCAWSVWMGPQAADGAGVLIERGASWEYLLFKQGTRPEDPGTVDGDFRSLTMAS